MSSLAIRSSTIEWRAGSSGHRRVVPATPAQTGCTLLSDVMAAQSVAMRHTASITSLSWIPPEAIAAPEKQGEPEVGQNQFRFLQTADGRTGLRPFVKHLAPSAWSTLALTMYADGRGACGEYERG